jgi:hypothetical protein
MTFMIQPRRFLTGAALALIPALPIAAQSARLVTVNGVAYDSLHAHPLSNALIGITGTERTTTSDSRGRFRFDSIAPGTYTFTMQHEAIDSAGFSGFSAKAVVTDGRAEVRIALPSFSTLWHLACGSRRESPDSGFVFGTIRDAEQGKVVGDATVELSWVDLTADKKTVHQRQYRAETRSDARGSYGICGVPIGVSIRVKASSAEGSSGLIDLRSHDARVQRMDLTVAATEVKAMGVISGRVTGPTNQPVAGARIVIEDLPEARTMLDGRFVVRQVPVGTRQLEVQAIGMAPALRVIDVTSNDTAAVAVQLRSVTTLETTRVTAAAHVQRLVQEIEDRKKLGTGHIIDSTQITADNSIRGTFATVPSVQISDISRNAIPRYVITLPGSTGRCNANVFVDGHRMLSDDLSFMRPDEIVVIEVYARKVDVPPEFDAPQSECGSVAVWTRNAFR